MQQVLNKELAFSSRAMNFYEVIGLDEIRQNGLLAVLSIEYLEQWMPSFERIDLPLGHVIYESGQPLTSVVFPVSGIVSLQYVMENGDTAQIAVVGNEGMIGVTVFMGGHTTPSRATVQTRGKALRLPVQFLVEAFKADGVAMRLLLRYTQALLTQISQTAVCNRHHTIDMQLCRWLLQNLDRMQGSKMMITHASISHMLGVRREGVTEATLRLQSCGLIRTSRGLIEVLDRRGLERRACECYAVIKKEYDRLLPETVVTNAYRG